MFIQVKKAAFFKAEESLKEILSILKGLTSDYPEEYVFALKHLTFYLELEKIIYKISIEYFLKLNSES